MTSQKQTDVLHVFYLLPTFPGRWTLSASGVLRVIVCCFVFFACVLRGLIVIGELLLELCLHTRTHAHTHDTRPPKWGKTRKEKTHLCLVVEQSSFLVDSQETLEVYCL